MTWETRSVKSFPSNYRIMMKGAIIEAPEKYLAQFATSPSKLQPAQTMFRKFRYLIGQQPDVDSELTRLRTEWQFRATIEPFLDGYALYVHARPSIPNRLALLTNSPL